MFFPVEFKKLSFRSNASRKIFHFFNYFSLQTKIKTLSLKKKWKAGRNDSGRIILWTRRKLNRPFKHPLINHDLRYSKLCFIASFQFIPFSNKLLMLIFFSGGAITYYNMPEDVNLFSFYYFNFRGKRFKKFFPKFWATFIFLKKLIFISFIEIKPGKGAQYVLSAGTKGKLFAINKLLKFVIIQLPSKVKKIFSLHSATLIGRNMLMENKFYKNTKSGYWRNFGRKSIVRGVAMNPIDHPHGGRTKAIRHQRTPWGKTTKLK